MARRKPVPRDKFRKLRDTIRAYRLWNGTDQEPIVGRHYRWVENAKDAATMICRREIVKKGTVVELLDRRRGHLIGLYQKTSAGIGIKEGEHLREEEVQRKAIEARVV